MNTHIEAPRSQEGHRPNREVVSRLSWAALMLLVAVGVGVGLAGCGESSQSTSQSQDVGTVVQPAESGGEPASQGHVSAASSEQAVVEAAPVSDGSQPPDFVPFVTDTLVAPGESVDVTVQGTPDIVEVVLRDGIHDPQGFRYDAASKTWQLIYRVPLRRSWERIGLSVTARNDANRWRRMWLFLKTHKDTLARQP